MSQDVIFSPAPGWPPPPPDWQPQAGWQPDPAWPDAPAGWVFYRTPDGAPAPTPVGGWEPPAAPAWTPPAAATAAPADPYAAAAAGAVPGAPVDPYASGTAPVMAGGSRNPDGTWQPDPEAERAAAEAKAKTAKRTTIARIIVFVLVLAVAGGVIFSNWWTKRYETPLNQAQFLNLINQQMPVNFGSTNFVGQVAASDIWYDSEAGASCAAYEAFDGSRDQMQSAGVFNSAPASFFLMANFKARADAEDIAKATKDCLGQIGLTDITETTAETGGVGTWAFTGKDPGGEPYTVDIAVFHNIMAYTEDVDQAEWSTFVATTFPQAVNAARK